MDFTSVGKQSGPFCILLTSVLERKGRVTAQYVVSGAHKRGVTLAYCPKWGALQPPGPLGLLKTMRSEILVTGNWKNGKNSAAALIYCSSPSLPSTVGRLQLVGII
jgi:hypothetical protein